mmetsp:Transcript_14518/g.21401  ORF Transcript_14518/g.21401 Transcript_14518/m.21401 type:complete len:215 (+) Transcript_14518:1718-2362(+)
MLRCIVDKITLIVRRTTVPVKGMTQSQPVSNLVRDGTRIAQQYGRAQIHPVLMGVLVGWKPPLLVRILRKPTEIGVTQALRQEQVQYVPTTDTECRRRVVRIVVVAAVNVVPTTVRSVIDSLEMELERRVLKIDIDQIVDFFLQNAICHVGIGLSCQDVGVHINVNAVNRWQREFVVVTVTTAPCVGRLLLLLLLNRGLQFGHAQHVQMFVFFG